MKTVHFPATCALLQHPRHGYALFDTGYSTRFQQATRTFPERGYRWATPVTMADHGSAVEQLRQKGLDPTQIGTVIVSHFHADHVAGLGDFAQSTVVYDASGLAALRSLSRVKAVRAAFLATLVPDDLVARSWALERGDERWRPGEWDHWDLWGDGSLLVVPLPGHAPGHCGALFRTDQGPVFLVADAAWNLDELSGRVRLTRLSAHLHADFGVYLETQQRLSQFLQAHPEVTAIPTHGAFRARPQ